MRTTTYKASTETFSAIRQAEEDLKKHGFIIGSMCRDLPIGFADSTKYKYIAKWENLSADDKKKLSGEITSSDFRNGDVIVTFY